MVNSKRAMVLISALQKHKNPIKLLLSIFLRKTRLCSFLIIDRGLYRIRFFSTALSQALWINPEERKVEEELFQLYLREGDNVIDVGANIGTISLPVAATVGKSGKVFSIEPHPLIFKYLMKNIALNQFGNIYPYNVAIGDKKDILCLSDKSSDDQNNVVMNSDFRVVSERLDDLLLDKLDAVTLLKIDVEGYEIFVLRGARDLLRITECVYFESSDQFFSNYGYDSRDVISFLTENGYTIYWPRISKREIFAVSEETVLPKRANLLALKHPTVFLEHTGFIITNLTQN